MLEYCKINQMNGSETVTEVPQHSCSSCVYFTYGVSENGYCKLYHHNIAQPGKICSRFELSEKKASHIRFKKDKCDAQIKSETDYKYDKHLFYIFGVVLTAVLSIISMFVTLILARTIRVQDVSSFVKTISIVADIIFFTLFVRELYIILRKHRRIACAIYFVFFLAILFILMFNYNNIWLIVNNIADTVVNFVFYELFKL